MTSLWRAPLLVLSLVAVLALAATGCGSSDDDSSSTGTAVASTQASGDGGGSATTTEDASDDSGGGSGDDFCERLTKIGEDLQNQGNNMSDPQKMGEYSKQVADALRSADPPAEIKDEWATLTDLFDTLASVMANVDINDPSSLTEIQDDLQEFQGKAQELSAATQALSQYAADNCGGGF